MLKRERHVYILRQLNLHNRVINSELCKALKISEDTVRRDLQELSDSGQLFKVHGGALSMGFNDANFGLHPVYLRSEKNIIAQKAVKLIQNDMFVMTTGGTTILEMVNNLPVNLKAAFITGSIPVVNSCLGHPNIQTIVIGGRASQISKLTYGAEALKKIQEMKADLFFLGTNAIDLHHGLTENDWEVVQIKKAMLSVSKKVVCMVISEKLQSFQPIRVCDISGIDFLITELEPDNELLKPYREAGITVM